MEKGVQSQTEEEGEGEGEREGEQEELDVEQERDRDQEEYVSSSSEDRRFPAIRARDYYKYTGIPRAARRVRSGLGKAKQELWSRKEHLVEYDWDLLRERLLTPLTLLTLVLHAAVPLHLIYLSLTQ